MESLVFLERTATEIDPEVREEVDIASKQASACDSEGTKRFTSCIRVTTLNINTVFTLPYMLPIAIDPTTPPSHHLESPTNVLQNLALSPGNSTVCQEPLTNALDTPPGEEDVAEQTCKCE